jgi:hypothetical protein
VEEIDCNFCGERFSSEDILTEHKSEKHRDESASYKQPNEAKSFRKKFTFTCKFCEEDFDLKSELMKHSKMEHTKSLSVCWNFVAGCCDYEESFCWFAHEKNKVNMMCTYSKCNIYDLTLKSRPEYLKHRKQFHIDIVPECKNKMNGACQYGNTNCWFKYKIEKYNTKEQNESDKIEHNKVVEKLFDIVEKVTERLAKLEKSN